MKNISFCQQQQQQKNWLNWIYHISALDLSLKSSSYIQQWYAVYVTWNTIGVVVLKSEKKIKKNSTKNKNTADLDMFSFLHTHKCKYCFGSFWRWTNVWKKVNEVNHHHHHTLVDYQQPNTHDTWQQKKQQQQANKKLIYIPFIVIYRSLWIIIEDVSLMIMCNK